MLFQCWSLYAVWVLTAICFTVAMIEYPPLRLTQVQYQRSVQVLLDKIPRLQAALYFTPAQKYRCVCY